MKRQLFASGSIILPYVAGEGVGEELKEPIMAIHAAAGSPFLFHHHYLAGQLAIDAGLSALSKELLDAFDEHKILLKGPLGTPAGGGFTSLNVALRQKFNLYNNFRPVATIPGVKTAFNDVNLWIIRENTESLYKNQVTSFNDGKDNVISFSLTYDAGVRIMQAAAKMASEHGKTKITLVGKSNIIKPYGAYEKAMKDVAPHYPHITFEYMHVDAYAANVVMNHKQFQVVVTCNMFGDILSDLHAGMIGGLGFATSANIGDEHAMFEAVHGTGEGTIAGLNKANPTAVLLSSCLALRHKGDLITADRIQGALFHTIENNIEACTPDCLGPLATKEEKAAHTGNTTTMKEAIIATLADINLPCNQEWLEASGAAVTA